jgi:sugar lactone lactonase YvrE
LEWGTFGKGDGEFDRPRGIAVSKSKNVYVADAQNNRIQKFNSNGEYISEWACSWGAQIAVDNAGNVYVAYSAYIGKYSANGNLLATWGVGQRSLGVAIDSNGYIYISDNKQFKIYKLDSSGNIIKTWGSYGTGHYGLINNKHLAVDSKNNVYVADSGNSRIIKYDSNGSYILEWDVDAPEGLAVDGEDNIIASTSSGRMHVFDSEGNTLLEWGTHGRGDYEYNYPYGIAVDKSGVLYVTDVHNSRVIKYKQK